jgi:hypothetical protein
MFYLQSPGFNPLKLGHEYPIKGEMKKRLGHEYPIIIQQGKSVDGFDGDAECEPIDTDTIHENHLRSGGFMRVFPC